MTVLIVGLRIYYEYLDSKQEQATRQGPRDYVYFFFRVLILFRGRFGEDDE